jgi:hypothetical protein
VSRLAKHLFVSLLAAALAAQAKPPTVGFQEAFTRFQEEHGDGWTVWHGAHGVPYRMFGPGATVSVDGVRTIAEARDAAQLLLAQHGDLLAARWQDLREHHAAAGNRIVVLQYQQLHQGVPVKGAFVDFRFHKGDGRLSMLGATTVPGLIVDTRATLTSAEAVDRYVRLMGNDPAGARRIDASTAATGLEICADDHGRYQLCWRVAAGGDGSPARWRLWLHAHDGHEVHREQAVFFFHGGDTPEPASPRPGPPPAATLRGNIKGLVSPPPRGIVTANPATSVPLAGVKVTVAGVGSAFTDNKGDFSIPYTGTAKQNVTVSLAVGRWWSELKDGYTAPVQSLSGVLDPAGQPTNFVFNATPSEFNTAQANGVHYVMQLHDYLKGIVPSMTAIDQTIKIEVNLDSAFGGFLKSCNAFYGQGKISFFRKKGACNNYATPGVIAHEYTHFVDEKNGGVAQTPRSPYEGIADVVAMYYMDHHTHQEDIRTNGSISRSGTNTKTQAHTFGQPFSGFCWDFLTFCKSALGTTTGKAVAASAVMQSILANPQDMLDFILQIYIADDNDSNLNNGTPHIDLLAKAALKRHFLRPVFHNIVITHTPQADASSGSSGFTVTGNFTSHLGSVNGAWLYYAVGDGSPFSKVAMTAKGGGTYQASIPPVLGADVVRYYLEGTNDKGNTTRLPAEVGDSFVFVVGSKTTILKDDFETTSSNFTASGASSPEGWTRHKPFGRNYDPVAATSGSWVWGVNRSSTDERYSDKSNQVVRLDSKTLDLTGKKGVRLRFRRWLTSTSYVVNSTTSSSVGYVYVNGNLVHSGAKANDQAWRTYDLDISTHADNKASVVIRFEFQHNDADGVGGFTLDDVEVYAVDITPCPGHTSYSAGSTGSAGVPELVSVGGRPDPGNRSFGIALTKAKASSLAATVFGTAKGSIPFAGGTLAVSPQVVLLHLTTASGTADLGLAVPNSAALRGLSLFAQSLVQDSAAVGGVALSNAIEIKVCR